MRADAMDPAEPPSMLWGLDPIFSAFARLYVRDILQMTESRQVPGVYFYNSHPIYKVDILGTVVYKRERNDFFCYGVDDGTGVINCLCWKSELMKEEDAASKGAAECCSSGTQGGFNPAAELQKVRRAHQNRCCLEIGELLRVRGLLKTSRQQREVMASTFYKVDDPVMAAQISWMLELPGLYRQCYDRAATLTASTQTSSSDSSVTKATNILKDFLKERSVTRFRPYDVQDLLQPLISVKPPATDLEPVAGPSGCQQLRQLLKEALQVLQDQGVVYRRHKSQEEVYQVTSQDKDLLLAVKDVIREDSRQPRYSDKGCHVLHILSAVRQRHGLNVSRAALDLVLNSLECSSDIISTSDSHYTAF